MKTNIRILPCGHFEILIAIVVSNVYYIYCISTSTPGCDF